MKVAVVTGSRDWTDRSAIEAALRSTELLIVGDCPTGADAIALEIATAWDVIPVVMRADWKRHGNTAGQIRNSEIVERAAQEKIGGADVHCYAFLLPQSRGTRDCMAKMKAAGFEVNEVWDD